MFQGNATWEPWPSPRIGGDWGCNGCRIIIEFVFDIKYHAANMDIWVLDKNNLRFSGLQPQKIDSG